MNKLFTLLIIGIMLTPLLPVNATATYYGNFSSSTLLESNGLIRKWMCTNNTHQNNTVSTWTSSGGVTYIWSLTSDTDYIYAGGDVSPGKVSKISKSTMLTVSTWTSSEGVIYIRSLTSDADYIYAGGLVSPGKVSKISKSTMLTVSTWTSSEGVNNIRSLTSDADYIYAGGLVSPGKVSKINMELINYYEVWDGSTLKYQGLINPDINDFLTTISTPIIEDVFGSTLFLVIDIFCIILSIIGLWKVPLSALFSLIITVTVLLGAILSNNILDTGIMTLTVVTIVISAICLAGGYNRNS
jgi:hypothetical protein